MMSEVSTAGPNIGLPSYPGKLFFNFIRCRSSGHLSNIVYYRVRNCLMVLKN